MSRFLRVALPALVAAGTVLATALPAQAAEPFTVNDTAMLGNNNTTATVTGTIECADGQQYNITAALEQRRGLGLKLGTETLLPLGQFVPCDGTPQSFQVPVPSQVPPIISTWDAGPATASVTAVVEGSGGSDHAVVKTIELTS